APLDLARADFFFFSGRVVGLDVVVENFDELGDDLVAFERSEEAAIHVDGGFRLFGGLGPGVSQAGLLAKRASGRAGRSGSARPFPGRSCWWCVRSRGRR